MKKFSLLVFMLTCCMLFFAFTISRNLSKPKNSAGNVLCSNFAKSPVPAVSTNRLTKKLKQALCTITFSQGPNVSGTWVLEISGSAGTFQIAPGPPLSIPYGTYDYVGIHAAGGSSQSYNFSGSLCANSYSASGTSALFRNVTINCGSGNFSVN